MAYSTASSAGAVASRPALRQQAKLSRSLQQRGRQSMTARAVAKYSPEQLAFLERKKAESGGGRGQASWSAPAPAAPAPAPSSGSGWGSPAPAAPASSGWGSPAPAAPAASGWGAPAPAAKSAPAAGAAPPKAAGGYSPEQLAFLERKKAEAAGGGYSAPAPAAPAAPAPAAASWSRDPAPAAPSASGWGASAPAPAAKSAPAAGAAPPKAAGGYSPEQLAFLERKKAEAAGGGYSAPAPAAPAPAAASWSRDPAPAAPAASGWGAPAPAAPASSGWGAPAPAAKSAPAAGAAPPKAAGGYTAEQLAFLERKKAEKKGLGGTTVDTTGVENGDLKVIHAPLSFFAPNKLELKGPRKNVDWGNPHDYGRTLAKKGSTSVGSWGCSEGGWDSPTPRPTTEIFYVFSGQGSVSDPDGTKYPFGPGDVVILPRGWYGRWDITEHIHKVWFIHAHGDVKGAPTSPVVASAAQLEAAATGNLSSDVFINSGKMFDTGTTSVGFWSRGPGTFDSTKAKTECFYVLDGFFYLNNPDGSCQRCVAGDTIMLPRGWSGTWDIIETVKKVWVYTD